MFRNPLTDGVVALLVLLLFFGPKRLPMLSRSIGEALKEFKGGIADAHDDKQLGAAPAGAAAEAARRDEPGA
jgi:TatA/E family protein of Tat protein translocase